MMTLRLLAAEPPTLPTRTTWYLTDLAQALGKQELFTRQSPQKLKVLCEHALIESAISSNRIEGVEVDRSRINTLIFGKAALRDRDEEEVRGYRDALKLIHERGEKLPISEAAIKKLHTLSRGEIWDAGAYKKDDVDIIQTFADGRSRVRFKTVSPKETLKAMAEIIELWQRGIREKWVHPFVLAAALNLDFLVSTRSATEMAALPVCCSCLLVTTVGWKWAAISASNALSSPWSTINFLLYNLTQACKEFEQRLGDVKSIPGEKSALVLTAIQNQIGSFSVADLQNGCPGVSVDLIRRVLGQLRRQEKVRCLGRGRTSRWEKLGTR